MMSNSTGIDNEMEILSSLNLAEQTVKDLKLYVKYTSEGRVRDMVIYKSQPISVDLDPAHLDKLRSPISMVIQRVGNTYHVTGSYNSPVEGRGWQTTNIDKKISQLPSTIVTKVGILSFMNENAGSMKDGESFKVSILPPKSVAAGYRGAFSVAQNNKTTSIATTIPSKTRFCKLISNHFFNFIRILPSWIKKHDQKSCPKSVST
ncbi:MAG: hypothetical protein KHX29_03760 [Prevotella buccalis]|nr:hypothetical protein [Hoylesella buccalis]